jgi:hypothetical protein
MSEVDLDELYRDALEFGTPAAGDGHYTTFKDYMIIVAAVLFTFGACAAIILGISALLFLFREIK